MATRNVVDPTGVSWNVRRRWYPWRRNMSMRELWTSARSDKTAEPAAETPAEESSSPRNIVLKVLHYLFAAIVLVGYGVGKVLFYTVVVVVFLVISVIELALELVVMPVTLVFRLTGQAQWPVEIGRQGEHFGTRHAEDYAAAGELRDGLIAQIEVGDLPLEPKVPAA